MIEAAPASKTAVLLTAVAVLQPEVRATFRDSVLPAHVLSTDILPEKWRGLPVEDAAALVLGARPVDLAPGLTAAEADAYLRWCAENRLRRSTDPADWVLASLGTDEDLPRPSLPVALWLRDRWRDPAQRAALTRERQGQIAGEVVHGTYLSRIDELLPDDLEKSVEATFRKAAERLRVRMERALKKTDKRLTCAPDWFVPVEGVTLLDTGPALVEEGRQMKHCVATYATAVQSKKSLIFGINAGGCRSTAEVSYDLTVRQHKAQGNKEPAQPCKDRLTEALAIWAAKRAELDAGPRRNPRRAGYWVLTPAPVRAARQPRRRRSRR